MRRRVVWALGVACAAILLGFMGRRTLLTAIGGFLIVQDMPHPADAIVVLSGSVPDRILEAVDLYNTRLAPRIVLTREHELPGLAALRARGGTLLEQHQQNLSVAQQLGVPASAISVMPTPTSSTIAEARALVAYLQGEGIHSILLVTSKAHARRARLIFRRVAGDNIRVALCPSHYDPFAADSWWHERAFVRRVIIEYGKLLNYLLIDRWRAGASAPATQ